MANFLHVKWDALRKIFHKRRLKALEIELKINLKLYFPSQYSRKKMHIKRIIFPKKQWQGFSCLVETRNMCIFETETETRQMVETETETETFADITVGSIYNLDQT